MDADNILNEFQKHMKQRNETISQSDDAHDDVVFDYNDMLMPDDIVYDNDDDHQRFSDLDSDMGATNQEDYIIVEELEVITPTRDHNRSKKSSSVTAPSATIKKTKPKTNNSTNVVDKYVNRLFQEDITASLKSLEKKYRKDHMDEGGLCEQCGLSFSIASEYKKHIRGHIEKGRCICLTLFFVDFSSLIEI